MLKINQIGSFLTRLMTELESTMPCSSSLSACGKREGIEIYELDRDAAKLNLLKFDGVMLPSTSTN